MQQKGSWVYTTRVNLHLNSKSSQSNVTSVALYRRGADGQTVVGEGATALFSHFIVAQPTTQDPRSMRSNLLAKNHTAVALDKLDSPPIINPTLFDDPAFSPDPLSNPLFSSNQPPSWSIPLGPGHPTINKRQLIKVDGEDFHPPQPPNTPAVPELDSPDNKTSARSQPSSTALSSPPTSHDQDNRPLADNPSSSQSTLPVSAVSSALVSSSPASDLLPSKTHVHPKVVMPHDVHPQSQPQLQSQLPQLASSSKPEAKKRSGFFSRLLGPSSDPSDSSTDSPPSKTPIKTDSDMLRMRHPPPHELGLRPKPIPQRHPARSAPEVHQTDRPVMPPRATTVGASDSGKIVPAVAAAVASERAAEERRLRQDLDRIDELDETNPFGAAVHHGGPYEAISRFVQKDSAPKGPGRAGRIQATGGRNLMMPGDVYRNAQLMALQMGSLKLKPGQILPHDYAPRDETPYPHPHPHSQIHPHGPHHGRHDDHYTQVQSQTSRHHDHHTHHNYAQSGAAAHELRRSLERPVPTQMAPSAPQLSSLGNYPGIDGPPPSSSKHPRRRTPSPTAATTHSSEDDAGLAIGMALMGADQDNSFTSSNTAPIVVNSNSETNSSRRSSLEKITSSEPSDEPSPPPSFHEFPEPSSSRPEAHRVNEHRSQERPPSGHYHREVVREVPITNERPQEPFSQQEFTPQPNQAPVSNFPHSYTPSQHPQPTQHPPPYHYGRPTRQEIYSLQPQPIQQRPTPINPGLSRSSTYAPSSSGQYNDRLALASALKTSGRTTPSFSMPSLRDRDSDNRSVQQSLMTMSNTSSRSQGGENPRRHRYIPKHLVMPTPLQPTMQNQAMPHRVQLIPQTNPVYSREPSPPKVKHSSLPPRPRAQDIPMAPSNGKLRKRISLMGAIKGPSKEPPAPVAAVSFSANFVSADRVARGPEKVNKKVLNKRK